MRLVQLRGGVLEIRWTWLPFWLAVNPKLKADLEREMRDAVLMCGVTTKDEDLDRLHDWAVKRLGAWFPFPGIALYLDAIKNVEE